jgi:predicted Zn finger-like uncharacterized protein
LIVTCPECRTRYRVDAKALTRPGGRTVRCAACGHSWHLPPAALDPGRGEPAKADLPPLEPTLVAPTFLEPVIPAAPPPFEPALAAPTHPNPRHPTPGTPAAAGGHPWASLLAEEATGEAGAPFMHSAGVLPRRRRWIAVALPVFVVLIVLLAAIYLSR